MCNAVLVWMFTTGDMFGGPYISGQKHETDNINLKSAGNFTVLATLVMIIIIIIQ